MRISSSQYFSMNVQTMSDQQATLASMYQQISSGTRLLTASDDPLGAAQAVQLSMKGAALTQYATNQGAALSSLQQEDSTLTSVNSVMQSIKTQVVRAGDASLNDADRTSIANTIKGYRDQLMSLANTTDGSGNYIFSGFKTGAVPFTNNASGIGATYSGDLGQRQVQLSDTPHGERRRYGAGDFPEHFAGAERPGGRGRFRQPGIGHDQHGERDGPVERGQRERLYDCVRGFAIGREHDLYGHAD